MATPAIAGLRARCFIGALGITAVGYALLPLAFSVQLGWLVAITLGIGAGPLMPLINTVFQRRVPAALMGRTLAASNALALCAVPIGMLAGGAGVEWLGTGRVLYLIAGTMLAVVIVATGLKSLHALASNAR